ncbi:hypothetical protein [Microvirga sp. 2TAF3]|uniref:hypothetical protein n=1 Tax=Microvirga sp. 2TAF3 TaxID=3233014 RepID=UPI003F95ACB3
MNRRDAANSRSDWSQAEDLLPYERVLALGIKEVVSELCLADTGILTSYVCKNLHANIEDLLDSSSELYLKEGTLRYSHVANLDFEWGNSPAAVLNLEFVHPPITVFFKLVLHGFHVGVAIQRILVSDPSGDETLDTERFARVVTEARLIPLPTPPSINID